MTDNAVETFALGRRYGGRRTAGKNALQDCTASIPAGAVCALVGHNGAGKSTLLQLAAGLLRPTEGELTVLGTTPAEARSRVAFLAQDKPLHPQLTVAQTLWMGAELNPGRFDEALARRVLEGGALDEGARVRSLSGGLRTRLALALALGKRPELLLLDEPMADLDPLARHELMGLLLAEAAESGTTVVMSSHILGELATSCDHLVLLASGRVRLSGAIDELLACHTLVTGRGDPADLAPHPVIESRASGRGLTALVRNDRGTITGNWDRDEPALEELLLAYLRDHDPAAARIPQRGTRTGQEAAA